MPRSNQPPKPQVGGGLITLPHLAGDIKKRLDDLVAWGWIQPSKGA